MTYTLSSNRLERLASELLRHLLDSDVGPFTRQIVVVPHPSVRSWLRTFLTTALGESGVLAGVTFVLPAQALAHLENLHGLSPLARRPSPFALGLWLEEFIDKSMLAGAETARGQRLLRSRNADVAASAFLTALDECSEVQESWPPWQQALWKRAREGIETWGPQALSQLSDALKRVVPACRLHLFGLEASPRLPLELLTKWSLHLPAYHYRLQPCRLFWQDLVSDRFGAYIEEQYSPSEVVQERVEELLWDRNRLLANWGRVGRLTAAFDDEYDLDPEADYVMSQQVASHPAYVDDLLVSVEEVEGGGHLLDHIQADLLVLRNPDGTEPIAVDLDDRSLQVHHAPSRLRELEVIHDRIVDHFDGRQIEAGQVLILTPNPHQYVPLLPLVFGDDSPLKIVVEGAAAQMPGPLCSGFIDLLNLGMGRWDVVSVSELFELPAVRRALGLSTEMLESFRRWMREFGLRWGLTGKHRSDLLQAQGCGSMVDEGVIGTWQAATRRVLRGIAWGADGKVAVAFSEAEAAAKWLEVLDALEADLLPLVDGTERTVVDWCRYLSCLYRAYFVADRDQRAQLREEQLLFEVLEGLAALSDKVSERQVAYDSLHERVIRELQRQTVGAGEEVVAPIRLSALEMGAVLPASLVAIVGLDAETFPRRGNAAVDRYLMLQAVLAAREVLHLSYSGTLDRDRSVLLSELLTYLDKGYGGAELYKVSHPLDSSDPQLFSLDAPVPCRSLRRYQVSMAKSIESTTTAQDSSVTEEETTLVLDDLIRFATHPARTYCQRHLGVYLDHPRSWALPTDEPLTINPLIRGELREVALQQPIDIVILQAEQRGLLPLATFGEVARRQLSEELQAWQELMADTITVEMRPGCHAPRQEEERRWIVPPLTLSVRESTVQLIGEIHGANELGLVVDGGKDLGTVARIFPQYLALCALELPWCRGGLCVGGKVFPQLQQIAPLSLLAHYCQWLLATQMPPLLMPAWIKTLLSNNASTLQKEVDEAVMGGVARSSDPYLHLLLSSASREGDQLLKAWRPAAMELFEATTKAWFPRTKIGVEHAGI